MSNMATPFFRDGRTFPTKAQIESALDDLAELLSADRFTLSEIAELMSISVGTVCVLLRELCFRYGEGCS